MAVDLDRLPGADQAECSAYGRGDFQTNHFAVLLGRGDQETALGAEIGERGILLLGPTGEDADRVVDALHQELGDQPGDADAFRHERAVGVTLPDEQAVG